jgi:hypothetical protein
VDKPKLAYSRSEAADASGYSEATIKRAIMAGDLREVHPMVGDKPTSKGVITRVELERWLAT